MTVHIKAHFDGTAIVPDEPVDLPIDTAISVAVTYPRSPVPAPVLPIGTREERRKSLAGFLALAVHGLSIPDEALRREHLYGDEGH